MTIWSGFHAMQWLPIPGAAKILLPSITYIGVLAVPTLFLIFALIVGVQTIYNFFFGHAISGFSTVILLILITGSMIMLSLGVIGVYISRIYEEIKRRPRYIIDKKV